MGMNIGIFLAVSNEGRILRQICGSSYSTSEPLLKPNGVNIHIDGDDALSLEVAAYLNEVLKEGRVIVSDERVYAKLRESGVVRLSHNGKVVSGHLSCSPNVNVKGMP